MATLGDLEKIKHNITGAKLQTIQALHVAAYGEQSQPRSARKNVRKFTGYNLEKPSEEYDLKINTIKENLGLNDLIAVCNVLNLDYSGETSEVAERVCAFLNNLSISDEKGEDEDESTDEEVQEEESESDNDRETLADLRNRIMEGALEGAKKKDHSFALTFRDVEDTIRSFSGKDEYPVNKWISDFEELAEVTGWNDLQKLIFAKKSLIGLARLFIQSEKGIKSWKMLKGKLMAEFEIKVSSAQVHKQLMTRKKNYTETVREYALIMREIGSRASLEPEVVIQYIIDGIQDDTSDKIALYGAKNFNEFKEKIKLYDQIKAKRGTRGPSSEKKNHENNFDKKGFSRKVDHNKKERIGKCFSCGQQGHKSIDCPTKSKGLKCFHCDNFGHIAKKCPKQTNENKNLTHQIENGSESEADC